MGDRFTEDDQVVALRTEGRSFGRIAKTVGLPNGRAALEAFHRALCRRQPEQRTALCHEELGRLARLSERLEHSGRFDPAELVRQRQVVDRLRTLLLAN